MMLPPALIGPLGSSWILLVEDDPGIRSFITAALRGEGIPVASAEDGQDAIAWLRARRPALVLLDLRTAAAGEAVLHELLDLYNGAVPVITLVDNLWDVEAMRKHNAWAHLRKPYAVDDLLDAMRAYL
jgi:DNA-binding response OmpR family regulator